MWGVPAPPPHVEFIRDWFTPAHRKWTKALYGRGGFWIAGGCILWFIVLPIIALKFTLWATVEVVMLAAFLVTGTWDMATYRHRLNALR